MDHVLDISPLASCFTVGLLLQRLKDRPKLLYWIRGALGLE